MSGYCSFYGEDLGAGIWAHLVKYAPPPETNEMKYVIGANLIEENQDLWRETGALKSILLEIDRSCGNRKIRGGKTSIAKAKNFSELYYNEDDSESASEGGNSILKNKNITLDYVFERVDVIRTAIEDERDKLETLILQLNDEMDKQSESMLIINEPEQVLSSSLSMMELSSSTNPAHLSTTCSVCNTKPSNKLDPTKLKSAYNEFNATRAKPQISNSNNSDRFVCAICLEKRAIQDAKRGRNTVKVDTHFIQDFSTKTMIGSKSEINLDSSNSGNSGINTASNTRQQSNNNNSSPTLTQSYDSEFGSGSPMPSASPGGGGNSKFKNRLIAARDELHFLDDF